MHSEGLLQQVTQFLYREARLLDERRFREWLDLFTDDVRYWMPIRYTQYYKGGESDGPVGQPDYAQEAMTGDKELAFFDDTKAILTMRVAREETGLAWSDVPPGRASHIVTNVEIEDPADGEAELRVYSAFVTYRSRLERESDLFVGRREDVLRKVDGSWKIARRKIILDQNVLMAHNMSMFF